jgi:hypothetical protein
VSVRKNQLLGGWYPRGLIVYQQRIPILKLSRHTNKTLYTRNGLHEECTSLLNLSFGRFNLSIWCNVVNNFHFQIALADFYKCVIEHRLVKKGVLGKCVISIFAFIIKHGGCWICVFTVLFRIFQKRVVCIKVEIYVFRKECNCLIFLIFC